MKTNISASRRFLLPAIALGAIGLTAACSSYPESHVVSAPPPLPPSQAPAATVYTVPAPAQAQVIATTPTGAPVVATVPSPVGASSVVVMQAPPQAQQEVPTTRPTRDHVWVAGYWSWKDNSRYEWVAGHWVVPPRVGAVFVPPRWQPEGTNWRFYEGYWD
jgi:hypothetical protein